MPKTKKKFIDRKRAVTFNLVHRSQKDPLVADENAPQRVLVPVNVEVPKKNKEPELKPEQRKEEQRKYGIYFDDDYNYLQHLKDTREVTLVVAPKPEHKRKTDKSTPRVSNTSDFPDSESSKLQLPSSVFASEVEEDVGLLNRAAPQGLRLDLDPDVVAALDEDFNFDDPDNELEDNFIELAMAEGSDEDEDDDLNASDGEYSDGDDSDPAFASDLDSGSDDDEKPRRMPKWDKFENEETRSRFTEYSMSSSVTQRNDGLTLLDSRFEKMFAEYDDTELGALDMDEIEGFMPHSHDMLLRAAEHFENSQRRHMLDKEVEIARINRLQEIAEESSEEELVTVEMDKKKKWDCESILSTYSNLYNHPSVIAEPKKSKKIHINTKTGIPEDTLGTKRLTIKSLARFNAENDDSGVKLYDDEETNADTVLSTLSILSLRPKDETSEDRKDRKRLLKEYRRERRIEKKANKLAFKEEKKRQEKIAMNNRNNVQGNKIL